MRLSEAIRKGSELRPMGKRALFVRREDGVICSCALGAAYEAITGSHTTPSVIDIAARDPLGNSFPALFKPFATSVSGYDLQLHEIIAQTNDSGKFTREEIADWLESIGL